MVLVTFKLDWKIWKNEDRFSKQLSQHNLSPFLLIWSYFMQYEKPLVMSLHFPFSSYHGNQGNYHKI